jgi:hypothetical protein
MRRGKPKFWVIYRKVRDVPGSRSLSLVRFRWNFLDGSGNDRRAHGGVSVFDKGE